MKAATAKLLRAVIRLVEDDVRELADTVVEIDEREAAHYAELRSFALDASRHGISTRDMTLTLEERIADIENRLLIHGIASADMHSRRIVALCAVPGCQIEGLHRHE